MHILNTGMFRGLSLKLFQRILKERENVYPKTIELELDPYIWLNKEGENSEVEKMKLVSVLSLNNLKSQA